MASHNCCVNNCNNVVKPLHAFPSDESDSERFNDWLETIFIPELFNTDRETIINNYHICSRHFSKQQCVQPTGGQKFSKKQKQLLPTAVPDLHLGSFRYTGVDFIQTGLHRPFMYLMKKPFNKTGINRCAFLMWEATPLTPHLEYFKGEDRVIGYEDMGNGKTSNKLAKSALVFMLMSAGHEWSLPIAYYFVHELTKEMLIDILKLCISTIKHCDIDLVATLCRHDATYIAAVEELAPYLLEQNIVPLYDIDNIMRAVGENFTKSDVEIIKDGETFVASRKVITEVYKENHETANIKKGKGSLEERMEAAQIRCVHNLAKGEKAATPERRAMSEFITLTDTIHCSFASAKDKTVGLPDDIVTPDSVHHEIWKKYALILKNVSYITSKGKVRPASLECLTRTVERAPILAQNMFARGFNKFELRHFNQDNLKNFIPNARLAYEFQNEYFVTLMLNFIHS